MMTMPKYQDAEALAEAIARRCGQPQQHGSRWQACCPAHEDTHPSLSIALGTRGDRVVLKWALSS
jgi:hypothetical protein